MSRDITKPRFLGPRMFGDDVANQVRVRIPIISECLFRFTFAVTGFKPSALI